MIFVTICNIAILLISSIFDIRKRIIPNKCVLLAAAVFFVSRAYFSLFGGAYTGIYDVLICLCAVFAVPVVMFPAELITRKSFGAGDKKMLMVLALSLGAWNTVYVIGGMLVSTSVFLAIKKSKRKEKLPLAPFMLTSYAAVIVFL